MSTTSVRTATRRKIFDLLTAAGDLAGVQVSYAEPRTAQKQCVWLGAITGEHQVAGFTANRKQRDDDFTIALFVGVISEPDATGQDADETCETLFATVENVLADDPVLTSAGPADGLLWAVLGKVDGPSPSPAETGYVSLITAQINCKARLT